MLCFENISEALLRDKCLFVDGLGWAMNVRMLVGWVMKMDRRSCLLWRDM